MDEITEKSDKMEKLAREILILSRNTLLVNLRFLDMALSRFTYVPEHTPTLMTDGQYIFYYPMHILRSYSLEKEIPVRDYLHMVLHCVFRHMFVNPSLNRIYWNLACDIAVENIITELGMKSTAAGRESEQSQYIPAIRSALKQVTAEKIYAYLCENYPTADGLAGVQDAFCADDHEIWYAESKTVRIFKPGSSDGDGSAELSQNRIEEVWKQIGEKMLTDLETFSRRHGDSAGSLIQELAAVNREKYDYAAFLRKFATLGEAMKINDDEFDYIFYTYGLKLYDKMPLIEPLEYKEVRRIKEFVIAIDTSGSTSGELVQKFIQKTYNVLKSTESFFTRINLHIIQCDAEIQEHVKITNQKEIDGYLKTMRIHGLGGTDFRPVFQMVDGLIRDKEFLNLKGLIYFTDGYGTFPSHKPDYETAFVFIDDAYNNPDVPPWAIRLVLKGEEI